MEAIAPVAAEVNPPNPQQGLGTLSSLIGLKQAQQNLQTGQYKQQEAAAQAQQQQLAAQQQQGVQSFFSTWDPSQHIGNDGTTDIESAIGSSQFQGAGNAKPAIMQALLDIKNKQLTNKQSLANLNGTLLTQAGTQLGALAKDSDVIADKTDPATGVNPGRAKVDQYWQNFAKLSPDTARVSGIFQPMVDHAPPGKLGIAVQALQMQAQSASEQQAQQNPMPGAFNTGANILPTVTPRATGVPQLTGQAVPLQLSPAQRLPQPVTNAGGQILNRSPVSGQLSPAPQSGQNLNPTTPQVSSQTALAGIDNERYSQVSQGGSTAQTGITLAGQVEDLAAQVRTGKLSKEWTDRLAVLAQNQPGITARQMLSKYAAQLQTMALQNAPTDSARSQIESGMPNPETMDPDAVQQAAEYMGGLFGMNKARQQVADKYKQTNGSTMGLSGADDAFMRSADPLLFAYQQLPPGKERQNFLTAHGLKNRSALEDFASRLNQVNHYVGQ